MTYKKTQYHRAESLINTAQIFYADPGSGVFRGRRYPFILQDGKNNIFGPIFEDTLAYFSHNAISWWGGTKPTNHTLSSQIACLNHLFPFRHDYDAVLAIARRVSPEIQEVLPIATDKYDPGYIQFEAVSDYDHLNENSSTRGSNCTSVDALIYAKRSNGQLIILPIEWKYVEAYGNDNKANGSQGITRKARYTDLIQKSGQLSSSKMDVYYFEPFYQLMRQTLWAEQMIESKDSETISAQEYLHVHVIPNENHDLLRKTYPCTGKGMEDSWRSCIEDQSKYLIISPMELLSQVDSTKYSDLIQYLNTRYW